MSAFGDLARWDRAYSDAEEAFLAAVRAAAPRAEVAAAAAAVAEVAVGLHREAYERYHLAAGSMGGDVEDVVVLDRLTERTEVLLDLWRDLAAAYRANSA